MNFWGEYARRSVNWYIIYKVVVIICMLCTINHYKVNFEIKLNNFLNGVILISPTRLMICLVFIWYFINQYFFIHISDEMDKKNYTENRLLQFIFQSLILFAMTDEIVKLTGKRFLIFFLETGSRGQGLYINSSRLLN